MGLVNKTRGIVNASPQDIDSALPISETRPVGDRRPGNAPLVRGVLARWDRLINRPDLDFEESRKRRLFAVLILPGI